MKVISKDEFFKMIPDRGKNLMIYLGTQTSEQVFDAFLKQPEDYTCERYVYVELKFENLLQQCCIKLQYSRSPADRVLEAKEHFNHPDVEIVLDLKPQEAIIFDNEDERKLHFQTHSTRALFFKPSIHN